MAEVVDSIIAELVVKGIDQYEASFQRADKAHTTALRSLGALGDQSLVVEQAAARYKAGNDRIVQAEEQTTQRVSRARKSRSDAARAADEVEVASARAAAAERDRIAEREARRDESARSRVIRVAGVSQADPATSSLGRTVPREGTGQRPIPATTLAGDEAAVENAINHRLADQATLRSNLAATTGRERQEIRDKLALLELENRLRKAGLADEEIALRLAERQTLAERTRAAAAPRSGGAKNAEQFARGAGFYAATGGGAAIAGIGVAAAAYGTVQAVTSSLDYAKQISDTAAATGVSTKQLQVYQTAARQAGATNEQLASSFGRLNDQLGRAKDGDEQAAKTFKSLGINVKDFASAGDALPTVINQLAKVSDPADRATRGTRLFGEEYRRLDAVLGQGTGKLDALTRSLEQAGGILSDSDIRRLEEAQRTLDNLKNTLSVDLARVVAGNTDAILGLANAFYKAADGALKFASAKDRAADIGVLDRSRGVLNTDRTGQLFNYLTGAGPTDLDSVRREAFQRQLQSHDGRQALFTLNRAEASSLNSRASIGPDGKDRLDADRKRNEAERQEILRAEAAYRRELRTQPTAKPAGPITALNLAPKGPKGPKNKTEDQLAAEQAERDRQYADRLAALQEVAIRAREQLTGSITGQASIEAELADRALKKNLDDIELTKTRNIARINAEHATEADKKAAIALENAHAAELTAAARTASAAEAKVRAQETQVKLIEAASAHIQTQLSIDAELASINGQLATTRKERLDAELRLLDIQKRQERESLTTQLRTLRPDDPARQDVQARLDSLDSRYAGRAAATRKGDASPLEQYRDRLKGAVGDTKDALQQVEVNALGRLEDQIAGTIGKVLGLKGAFGELASSIISDLAKIEIERAILGATSGKGGGIGGLLSAILGKGGGDSAGLAAVSSGADDFDYAGLAGFANGGTATIGGNPGVDQNVLSINGVPALRVGQGEQLTVTPQNQVIAPNNAAIQPPSIGGGQITVHVQANDYFDARVAHISGPIAQNTSVQVVKAAAPGIARAGALGSQQVYSTASKLGPVS